MEPLSFSLEDLHGKALRLLDMRPDPVPCFRLLREVLRLDPQEAQYIEARQALESSKWVKLLRDIQLEDGTWGRFHSQDSRLKLLFPTTENAITAALDCGLDKDHPILVKAMKKVEEYATGASTWPDRAETHDNPLAWPNWVRHFSAAVLAQIDPRHPCLEEFGQIWAESVRRSFRSGTYDRQEEIAALNDLLGCRMKDPVPFSRKYPLLILSTASCRLPEDLEYRMLDYLLHAPQGIYYVCVGPLAACPPISSRSFWSWMQGQRLLSRFPLWKEICTQAVNWMWEQQDADGLWDLGGKVSRKPFTSLPLSESWKRPENRVIDSSVEVVGLLRCCFSD